MLWLALIRLAGGFETETVAEAETTHPWLDRSHAYVSEGVYRVSDRVDRFFDATGDEEFGETRVKVVVESVWRETKGTRVKARADVRLDLPRLEQRWNLFLQNVDLKNDPLVARDDDDTAAAGLRLLLRQTPLTRTHIDGGVRGAGGLALFGRLRWRWQHVWDPHMVRFTQFVRWQSREGFMETTRLEYECALASNYLFQTRSDVSWGESTHGVEWTQRVTLARLLRQRHGWALFAAGSGVTLPHAVMERVQTGVRRRTRVYKDWLYVDVEPYYEFERENGFRGKAWLALRVELLFAGRRD